MKSKLEQVEEELMTRYERDENFRKCINHPDLTRGFPLKFRIKFWAAKYCGFKGTLLDYGVLHPMGDS